MRPRITSKQRKLEVKVNITLTLLTFLLPFLTLWTVWFAAACRFDINLVLNSSAFWLAVILYELTLFPQATALLWRTRKCK